jgi:lipid-A-disaccharide synthase
MNTVETKCTILIVTGEASGDLHGAELAQALWKCDPSLQIVGIGGERMQKAGVRLIFDNRRLGVMGLVEVIRRIRVIAVAYRTVVKYLTENPVHLVVLIDSPDFNLRVAAVAKRKGIPAVYYIGPKVWAWRPGRVKTIRRLIWRMLVIFPFEEELYRRAGVPCRFVGHPLLDETPKDLSRAELRDQYGVDSEKPVVALLPGSRPEEIRRHLPVMLSAARLISERIPGASFLLPIAPSIDGEAVRREIQRGSLPIKPVHGEAPRVLAASDAAVIASGTATLEAALVGTPMVVVYKMAWLTYGVARMLVKVRDVSLVNIVAGRRVVPERLQGTATGKSVAEELLPLLLDESLRREMSEALAQVRQKLGSPGASMRAAEEIIKVLHEQNTSKTAPVLS